MRSNALPREPFVVLATIGILLAGIVRVTQPGPGVSDEKPNTIPADPARIVPVDRVTPALVTVRPSVPHPTARARSRGATSSSGAEAEPPRGTPVVEHHSRGAAPARDPRFIGDSKVFATVPTPGHPGSVLVVDDVVYVATFNPVYRVADDYDAIFSYDLRAGAPKTDRPNPIRVPRQLPAAIMGLAGMTADASGRIYVADMTGRVVRVEPRTGKQDTYATFPSNTGTALTAMPSDVEFDREGNLYVSDADAPVVWRVPPGGGRAEPWFVDPRLASYYGGGLAGIRIGPGAKHLYLALANGPYPTVYRVPLHDPDPQRLEIFHRYEAAGPISIAGLAFGRSGKLYVTLAFALDQVSVLRPDGTEERRFPSADSNAAQEVPYDFPAFTAFDGRGSLLVANVGTTPNRPQNSVVFDAFVRDTELPRVRPKVAKTAPATLRARPSLPALLASMYGGRTFSCAIYGPILASVGRMTGG